MNKNENNTTKGKVKILGIEIEFTGIHAGKIIFIIIITTLFLVHNFFYLKVPFILTLIAYLIPALVFIITLLFGCNIQTY